MIVRDNKKDLSLVIDFRETAPENTSPDLYESDPKTQHVVSFSIKLAHFSRC